MIAQLAAEPVRKASVFQNLESVIVIDVETSGLNPGKHSILEIGAVRFGAGTATMAPGGLIEVQWPSFEIKCRGWEMALPGGAIIMADHEADAMRINGRSVASLIDPALPTEQDAIGQFHNWLGDGKFVIAGLNPQFDMSFLRAAYARAGLNEKIPFRHRMIDLHTLAAAWAVTRNVPMPPTGFSTNAIYALLNMPDEPEPHAALTGARMEALAVSRILSDLYNA
jgi:DNA polymerase III epsilon subunit-like protein